MIAQAPAVLFVGATPPAVAGLRWADDGRDACAAVVTEPARAQAGAVAGLVASGAPVLGVGAGWAWLCERGWLPGRFVASPPAAEERQIIHARVEGMPTPFTATLPAGRVLAFHQDLVSLRYQPADPVGLAAAGRVVLRRCDATGGFDEGRAGPVPLGIAGVASESGHVVGIAAVPVSQPDGLGGDQLLRALGLWLAARDVLKSR